MMFVIKDQTHAEFLDGEFQEYEEALEELKRLATIPWDEKPNKAPCTSWKACGRKFEIVEYDNSSTPWKEISRIPILEIKASGVKWLTST